jgi:chaperonin GroEL
MSKIIEIRTGQLFSSTSESSTYYDYDGSGIFRFPKTPLISITKFEYNIYGNTVAPSWIELEEGYGKNLKTGKFGNMIKMGVTDPTLVTKSALNNAVSVATTIISSSAIITNMRADESVK